MFCPQCGSTQSDELKFCKTCGANLYALRQVMATRDDEGKFDWSKTWVAEIFSSGEDGVRKAAEIERLQGKTPEVKRRAEIKAGVVTTSVGLGLLLVLFVLMEGLVKTGRVSDAAVEILSRIWIVGVIPVMVGIALIVNGVFISKSGADALDADTRTSADELSATDHLNSNKADEYLPPANTNDLSPAGFSVTERTTKHLKQPR